MPQTATRPRIVETTPITPAFNPNEPPPIDINTLIQQMMTPTPVPQAQAPGIQDRLGSILQAVASGIGTGVSNDPGAALLNQIQQIKTQRFAKEQADAERRDAIDRMNRQFGMTLLRDQVGEQQDIRKEERAQKYNKLDREANFDLYLKKNAIEFQQDREATKEKREWQKADAILQHQWDLEKETKVDARFKQTQERLENKDLFDKKISLITAGIPAGLANTIASKMFNGEDLNPKESAALTAAAQKALRISRGTGSGGGSGGTSGLTEKQKFQYLNTRMKDQFVVVGLPDGTESVVEMSNAPRDIMGEIAGFKRIANDGEKMRKLSDEIDAIDAIRGKKIAGQGTAVLPTQLNLSAKWDGIIRSMKAQGSSDTEIANEIQQLFSKNPTMAQEEGDAINEAIVRNKGNKTKPEPPKESRVTQQFGVKLLEWLGKAVSK